MDPQLVSGLNLALVGLVIVFVVLSSTALLVWLIRRLDERWQRHEQVQEQRRPDRAPTIDAVTAVLIASAAATMIGGRTRIRSVRRLIPAEPGPSGWMAQGRATLLGSHVLKGRGGIERRP